MRNRELDALVDEKIMGLEHRQNVPGETTDPRRYREGFCLGDPIPRYSTEIASAWLVVERVSKWFQWEITHHRSFQMWVIPSLWRQVDAVQDCFLAEEDFVPRSICVAALKAANEPGLFAALAALGVEGEATGT